MGSPTGLDVDTGWIRRLYCHCLLVVWTLELSTEEALVVEGESVVGICHYKGFGQEGRWMSCSSADVPWKTVDTPSWNAASNWIGYLDNQGQGISPFPETKRDGVKRNRQARRCDKIRWPVGGGAFNAKTRRRRWDPTNAVTTSPVDDRKRPRRNTSDLYMRFWTC